jgi:hypothetical protein
MIRKPSPSKGAHLLQTWVTEQLKVPKRQGLRAECLLKVAELEGFNSYEAMAAHLKALKTEEPPLEFEDCTDYTLKEGHGSCWVTVGNISVYIRRNDEGVSVDLYPRGDEDSESLSGCWATFAEAEPDIEP